MNKSKCLNWAEIEKRRENIIDNTHQNDWDKAAALSYLVSKIRDGKYDLPNPPVVGIDVAEWIDKLKQAILDADDSIDYPIKEWCDDLLTAIEQLQGRRHVVVENCSARTWDVVDMCQLKVVFYTSMQRVNGKLEAQAKADELDGVVGELRDRYECVGGRYFCNGVPITEEKVLNALNALNKKVES